MSAYSEALSELRTVKKQLGTLRDAQRFLDGEVPPKIFEMIDKLETKHAYLYRAVNELRAANNIKL